MLFISDSKVSQVWTVVAQERGTTGVREALVTTELVEAGALTVETCERSWAADPYDADFAGVDRSVLRFISDDELYDSRFPQHPLSKVRRVIRSIPKAIMAEQPHVQR